MSRYLTRGGMLCALVLSTLIQSARAETADDKTFSAELALTSDYRFKGQSQSNRSSAVQGFVNYAHASGAFINVWASKGIASSKYALTEIDPSIGYSYELSDRASASVAIAYYWSQSRGRADDGYFEGTATYVRKFRWLELSAELSYSPDYSYHSGHAMGVTSAAEAPITLMGIRWLTASTHLGYQWIDDHKAYGTPNWIFYNIGLTGSWRQFALDLRFTGTNTEDINCFGGSNLCDGGVVLTLSANI